MVVLLEYKKGIGEILVVEKNGNCFFFFFFSRLSGSGYQGVIRTVRLSFNCEVSGLALICGRIFFICVIFL